MAYLYVEVMKYTLHLVEFSLQSHLPYCVVVILAFEDPKKAMVGAKLSRECWSKVQIYISHPF